MTTNKASSDIAGILDQLILFWLFLFAIFAPHSIAVTQGAWLLGMLFWVVRVCVHPRPRIFRTPIDYAMLGFFILTGLTAVLSYEPMVSIGKLRAASLFTIVYLFAENIPSRKVARALALTIVASCMVNVFYTAATRVVGRGVKIEGIRAGSPLSAATMTSTQKTQTPLPILNGDTILMIDGVKVRDAEAVATSLTASMSQPFAVVIIYRGDQYPPLRVPRGRLLPGASAEEQLGISSWALGRDWRAMGFYGHYVSYAEALQLITSLALGLFICLRDKKRRLGLLLLCASIGLMFALLLTVTRASWIGLVVSAAVMLSLGTSRRILLVAAACTIPLVIAGVIVLQQKRHVHFFDEKDGSTTWRQTVWKEGFHLLVSKPRHILIGVGMDSIKSHWRAWGLFDHGRIPIGHMHSNLLEIALERGVPALIVWLILLGVYARTLLQTFRRLETEEVGADESSQLDRGVVLGALGGLSGFFVSGLVHYNWGDSEVIMIAYFLMGISLFLNRISSIERPLSSRGALSGR